MKRKLNIQVLRVTIILGMGTDRISIRVQRPSPYTYNPTEGEDFLDLSFDSSTGKGVSYCRESLGLEPDEVVHTKVGRVEGPDYMRNLRKILREKRER